MERLRVWPISVGFFSLTVAKMRNRKSESDFTMRGETQASEEELLGTSLAPGRPIPGWGVPPPHTQGGAEGSWPLSPEEPLAPAYTLAALLAICMFSFKRCRLGAVAHAYNPTALWETKVGQMS